MTYLRLILSFTFLAAACGDKGTTSDSNTDADTTAAQTDTAPATTGADTTAATESPTTDATTGVVDPTAEPMTTTGNTTGCAGDCGVVVESAASLCDENNPDPVTASLMAVPNGPGAITVTEMGFETSCCLELDPQVAVDGMTLTITYTEVGDPCDCICYYTIDTELSGLAPGTWTVVSGSQMVDVDVQ